MRPTLSLKGRALALLAQREQSVLELRRKLTSHARRSPQQAASAAPSAAVPGSSEPAEDGAEGASLADVATRVDEVIAWLRQHDYLNENRFVETRVHARASRFGTSRIRRELAEHGLSLPPDAAADLWASEASRAAEVWQRKFGRAPLDAAAQARQTRFLVARGFSADVIRPLVKLARPEGRRDASVDEDEPVGDPPMPDD